jgi:hypothetical protein
MRAIQSDTLEKATATILKSKYGQSRLSRRVAAVQEFVRELMEIQSEMIAEQFTADILSRITGVAVTPELKDFLKNERMRSYRVDIQSDVTSQLDAIEEKAGRLELINYLTQALPQFFQLVQQGFPPAIVKTLLNFTVSSFKQSKEVQDSIESMVDVLEQQQMQAKEAAANQPPQPTDQELKMQEQQIKAQIEQQKLAIEQGKLQLEQIKTQADIAKTSAETSSKVEIEQLNAELEVERFNLQREELRLKALELELKKQELQAEIALSGQKVNLDTTNQNIRQENANTAVQSEPESPAA